MTYHEQVEWTCDCCGDREYTDTFRHPSGWEAVEDLAMDLCGDCVEANTCEQCNHVFSEALDTYEGMQVCPECYIELVNGG